MYWNKLSSMCCSPNKKQCFVNSRSIDIKMLWTPYSRGTIAIWTLEPYLAFFLNFGKIEFLHGQILYLDCLFTLNCANSVINPNGVNIRSMQILRPVVAFEWPFFTSLLWLVKLLANLLAMLLANHLVVRNSTQLIKHLMWWQTKILFRQMKKYFCFVWQEMVQQHHTTWRNWTATSWSSNSTPTLTLKPLIKLSYHWEVRPGRIHALLVRDFFQCQLFCMPCMLTEKFKYVHCLDRWRLETIAICSNIYCSSPAKIAVHVAAAHLPTTVLLFC